MTHPFPWREADQASVVDANERFVLACSDDVARLFLVRAVNQHARALGARSPEHALPVMDRAGAS
jgi:hypothetical protein